MFDSASCEISLYSFCPPLASSMMAPGLPEVAAKYNITNPTVIALTLSIFLITFAFGVNHKFQLETSRFIMIHLV